MENDYDNTDYECYLLGCRSAGIEPDRLWRFQMQQEAYLRRTAEAGQDPRGHSVPEVVLAGLNPPRRQGRRPWRNCTRPRNGV